MQTVTDWSGSFFHGLSAGMERFMVGIPTVLGAIVILVIGWFIAGLVAKAATSFFRAVHLDTLANRIGVNDFLAQAGTKLKASNVLAETLKWVMRLVFIQMAADQLGLPQVTAVVNAVLFYIPNILVALLVLGVGAFFGQLLAGVVRGAAAKAGMRNPEMMAKLASGAVMAFAIIAAINQLGISPVVVNTLYIGLVAAISLALGLAFGLGGRDAAGRLTEQWVNQIQATTAQANSDKPIITARSERIGPVARPTDPDFSEIETDETTATATPQGGSGTYRGSAS